MVDKFNEILKELSSKHRGAVSMLALLKMDDLTNKWSIVLSAPWITQENRGEMFREFINIINKHLSEEETSTIARVGIFTLDAHIVRELFKYQAGTHIQEKTNINGNIIHEAYIIASESNATITEQ